MLEEAAQLENIEVFTPWGVSIGLITSLEIDSESCDVEASGDSYEYGYEYSEETVDEGSEEEAEHLSDYDEHDWEHSEVEESKAEIYKERREEE